MTTYLFIGLILLLAAYLVNARRRRGDGSASATPRRERASRTPATPSSPMPPAVAAAESAAAHAAPPRIDALPARPEPVAEPVMPWTPDETIVEPGWPLPGEISGGWSTAPSSTPPPAFSEQAPPGPLVEWRPMAALPAADADAPVVEAGLSGSGEWAMPSIHGSDPVGSGPPIRTPGAPATEPAAETSAPIDPSAIWLAEPAATSAPADADPAAWQPKAADVPDAPPLAWSAPAAAPEAADGAPGPSELAWAAGPSIAPEPESPVSVWASPATASEPESETETAEAGPATDRFAGEIPGAAPASVPGWIAAAAPEHAAFAAEIFEEPVPPPLEPYAGPAEMETPAPADVTPETPVLVPAWTEAPAPISHDPAPAPSPLAGLVPLTSVCDHLGVTPRMLALMRILADTPMSVNELARLLSVSRPLVADLCTRLQAAGLAERERDDADRRRVRVVLTEAGHLLCAETATSPETGSYEAVLAGLSPAERAQLLSSLQARERYSS